MKNTYSARVSYHNDESKYCKDDTRGVTVQASSFGEAAEKILEDFEYGEVWKITLTKNTI